MMADLDDLKQINDRFGHRSGDEALRRFADCLVRNFPRRSDFIARYGGDEFVAILPQTPPPQSERLALRFLDAVDSLELVQGGQTFKVSRLGWPGRACVRRDGRKLARTGRPRPLRGEGRRSGQAHDRARAHLILAATARKW